MSIDTVIAKITRELPGFGWSVGTCCVSDDALIFPDINDPIHGPALKRVFGVGTDTFEAGSLWDSGAVIERSPSGNPGAALQQAFDEMVEAMQEAGLWEPYRTAMGLPVELFPPTLLEEMEAFRRAVKVSFGNPDTSHRTVAELGVDIEDGGDA